MPDQSHNKSVIYEVPEIVAPNSIKFTQEKFLSSINSKGYNVTVENSVRCGCIEKVSGQALMSCVNCGGLGMIFVNKRTTKAVIQNMNRNTKYRKWTEEDSGTVNITVKPKDALAELDRIINLDLTSIYSEKINLTQVDGVWKGLLIYEPIDVTHAYLFLSPNQKLASIVESSDFTIEGNLITLGGDVDLSAMVTAAPQISVRYEHNPVFHIVEIIREDIATTKNDCSGEEVTNHLPQHCVGRRSHYMLDYAGLNGEGLEDNSSLDNIDLDSAGGRLPL